MKVLMISEGAFPNPESMRLPVVYEMAKAWSKYEIDVTWLICGLLNIDVLKDIIFYKNNLLNKINEHLYIQNYKSYTKWAFSPFIIKYLNQAIKSNDILTLHSVYSFATLLGFLLSKINNKPYCLWLHGSLAPFLRQKNAYRKRVYEWLFVKKILSKASLVVFSSQGEKEEVTFLKIDTSQVVVPHGLNLYPFQKLPQRGDFRKIYCNGHQGPLILFLSRINIKKGLEVLIQSFSKVVEKIPNVCLAIVGNSDPPGYENKLRSLIKQLGLSDKIILTGSLYGEKKYQAYADSDIFVLPSYEENFGMVIFEAMASKIPVVISNTLNYAKEIESCGAGLSVNRDPISFSQALLSLIKNKKKRMAMGKCGFCMVQKYTWEKNAELIYSYFNGIK